MTMPATDGRMGLIGAAILEQAEQEAQELIDRANHTRDRELKLYESELVDAMFGTVQARSQKIRREAVKAAALEQLEAHREMLSHRAEKTEAVFAAVAERLRAFAKTPGYRESAVKTAEALKKTYGDGGIIITADKALGEALAAALGFERELSDDIAIGGFRLSYPEKGLLLDETLDEKLEEQRPAFLERCGLRVM
jgi:vacuolar-type H+-ATPase subunit E/Vma4